MVFRYWLEAERIWWKPWKWRIVEWHSYEVELWCRGPHGREPIASAQHGKTGRYIADEFNSKKEAEDKIFALEYKKYNNKEE